MSAKMDTGKGGIGYNGWMIGEYEGGGMRYPSVTLEE